MKKKLVIVGGGITACALALYASRKNFSVEIYEKNNSLGGILRDEKLKNDLYFKNCQYLNPNDKWYKKLFKKNLNIKTFNHSKFSFCKFENEESFCEDIAGFSIKKEIDFEKIVISPKKINTLKEKIQLYPIEISSQILKWLSNFDLNIDSLSVKSSDGLGLKRVFPQKNLLLLKKIKKKNKIYDSLFGLPNNLLYSKKILAALPKRGFNSLFDQIKRELRTSGVKFFFKSVVKPEWKNNLLFLKNKKDLIKSDYFFWSGNPTGLIKSYGLPLLDSANIKGKNYFFNLSGKIENSFYIQIYDINYPVSRMFIYKLQKRMKLTVETISNKMGSEEVRKYCQKIFDKFFKSNNFRIKNNNFSIPIKKYVLVTNKDFKIIQKFNNKTKNTNLIQGSWLKYSRDEKIDFAIKNFLTK